VLSAAFLLLQFGFLIIGRKDIGAKAARKMLMKLIADVKITKEFQAASPYERVLHSFCLFF